MLQVMLAYGISIDLLAFNAAQDVEVIASRADDVRQIIPPDREVMRQIIELADERFCVILLFAASTGVRAGELHAPPFRSATPYCAPCKDGVRRPAIRRPPSRIPELHGRVLEL